MAFKHGTTRHQEQNIKPPLWAFFFISLFYGRYLVSLVVVIVADHDKKEFVVVVIAEEFFFLVPVVIVAVVAPALARFDTPALTKLEHRSRSAAIGDARDDPRIKQNLLKAAVGRF